MRLIVNIFASYVLSFPSMLLSLKRRREIHLFSNSSLWHQPPGPLWWEPTFSRSSPCAGKITHGKAWEVEFTKEEEEEEVKEEVEFTKEVEEEEEF